MSRYGFTAALALGAALLAVPPAAAGDLKVLVPPQGATFASTPATLIGTGAADQLEVVLNGRKLIDIKRSGDAFTGPLPLAEGKNVLLVKSGVESLQTTFDYRAKPAGALFYRYHDPVGGGECKACHPQGVGRTTPVTEAKFCHACHDPKTGAKYLHGPLGTGQCSICHDPHGSSYPSFLVTGVRELCVQCHAQSRSKAHVERKSDKLCPACHDPHGSEKQYLLH